jgi:hypothetical protein
MRRSISLLISAAAVAVAIGLAFTAPLCADTVRVHKSVMPAVAATAHVSRQDADHYSCWPAICSDPFAAALFQGGPDIPSLVNPPDGGFVVGYKNAHDPGTGPCNCAWYIAWAYRGTVLFKIDDIPHHFTSATLVLKAQNVDFVSPLPDGVKNVMVPLTGIFDTSAALSVPLMFPGGSTRLNPEDGSLTAVSDAEKFLPVALDPTLQHPFIANFPAPPYPSGAVTEKSESFNYRIDVAKPINAWFADWLNRDQTPLRGFILVGANESLPQDSNTSLLITYEAHLEFDIDEPDR